MKYPNPLPNMTSTQRLARALVALAAATDALDAAAARSGDPATSADAERAHDALCPLTYSSDKDTLPNRRNYDRYLQIVRWQRKRSTIANGKLVSGIGGKPSRYTLICEAAFQRYINF